MRSKMLRLPIFLLFLVTTVFAATQNGWNEGKVYTYKIRSRTLAAVNPQSKQFAGILMKADLSVQPNSQNLLRAKISQPRYSRIHTKLENGWDMEIPKEKMKMMDLPLSDKPFEVKIQNGVIRDLVVDEEVPTWEVNMLKSIVSQLQVDTQGQNAKKSKQRQAPETRQPFASFRTMEDSVGGKCEVLYDISPVPEQTLQKKPELAPMLSLREDGEIISLVKTKNFSHCSQRVSYHLGINGRNTFEPGDNDNGRYLSRSSVSRIVISGNLKRYTIQSSVTNNKVILNPDQQDNQQGFVASKMNLTLIEVKDATEPLSAPAKPQSVGNLVYNYNSPFESASSRRPNRVNEDDSRTADESKSSFDSMQNNDGNNYLQSKPKLSEPPQNPMLPYFVGNGGNSIQNDEAFDAVKAAKDTARQIANDMRKPDEMVKEQTLEKYVILSRLIRTMSAHQIEEAYSDLYELPQSSNQVERDDSQNQNDRRNAWVAFRDATANAGTGPALINIKQWIQNRKIEDSEAAVVLNSFIKSVQIPTPEFLNAVFDLVKMQETKEQPMLRDTAVLSFTDLIRHTIVNKRSAHNRYPVHAFGRLFSKNNRDLHKKYIPYIMEELESAIKNGDSKKVEVYTVALGNTGHPRILSILEPYIEGRKPISPFQRLIMVMSLEKLTSTYPKHARSVLYKIYSNNGDHHEIRCAAVFMLMKTNPPASMLQRMAEATNHESNKHVNSAVKSSIESLAQLRSDDTHELSNAAKAALPLLTNKNFGIDSSRAILKEFENPQTRSGFSIEAKLIGSEDSIIPKGVSITINPVYNGLKVAKVHLEGVVSTIQNLWDFVEDKLKLNEQNKNWNEKKSNRYSDDNNDENDDKNNSWDRERNNRNSNENTKDDFNEDESRNPSQRSWNDSKSKQRTGERKYSPEYISRLLGIRGDDPQEIEGFIRINEQNLGNYFLPFDNHSLESLPQRLNKFDEIMKKGAHGDYTKFSNYELTISFPTETGYPLTFTLKTPTLMSVNIKADSATRDKPDLRSPIPKSATVNGKLKLAYAVNIQKRIGFVTPFERKEYLAGVDRNLNLYLPIHSEIKYDVDKKEAQLKLQAHDKREVKIAQLETRPFTSEHDALSLQPVFTDENTHTIKNNRMSSSKVEYKDKNNNPRVKLQWETESDESTEGNEESMTKNPNLIGVEMKLARSLAAFTVTDDSEKTKYEKYSAKVSFDNDISAEMRVSYDTLSKNWNNDQVNSEALNAKAPDLDKSYDENKRKEHFLEEVTKNINSVRAKVVDMTVQMTGAMSSSAAFTAAISNSEVDEKSRGQLFASLRTMDGKDYHLGVGLEIKNPNVDSFDYEETLKANTGIEYDLDIHFGNGRNDGENKGEEHRMRVRGNTKPSEERKNEIRQSRDAQMCTKDKNQSKNKMTAACQRVNKKAAFSNAGNVEVSFEDNSPLKQAVLTPLDFVESWSHVLGQMEKDRKHKSEPNKIQITYEISHKKKKADISVKTPEGKMKLKNIDLSFLEDEENENNKVKTNPLEKNQCFLDKSDVETFDNHRYTLQLGQCWHVVMTSYPKTNSDKWNKQKNIPKNMQVTVLAKEDEKGQKKIKITLGEKEVELSPSESGQPQAKINNKPVKLSKKKSHEEKKDSKSVLELFELPDNSIKLVSDEYNLKLMYDGSRAEIEVGERYRKSIRGLCGNNDGESDNDQQTPKGCQLEKSNEFSATWALTENEECKGPARENAEKAKNSQCIRETVRFGDVISDEDADRESSSTDSDDNNEKHCTHHRTKVLKTDNEICFSLRPIPVCSSKCSPIATATRKIQYHCVPRNSASEKVAKRIESGANPDLSQKTVSKFESQEIPIRCKP